jgi:hypothetical protein
MGVIEQALRLTKVEDRLDEFMREIRMQMAGLPVHHKVNSVIERDEFGRPVKFASEERAIYDPARGLAEQKQIDELKTLLAGGVRALAATVELSTSAREKNARLQTQVDQLLQVVGVLGERCGVKVFAGSDGRIELTMLETSGADTIRLSGDVYELSESLKTRLSQFAGSIREGIAQQLRADLRQQLEQEMTMLRSRIKTAVRQYVEMKGGS